MGDGIYWPSNARSESQMSPDKGSKVESMVSPSQHYKSTGPSSASENRNLKLTPGSNPTGYAYDQNRAAFKPLDNHTQYDPYQRPPSVG